MRDFWDAAAREDAYFFIDDRLQRGSPDRERFWGEGPALLDHFLGELGAAIESGDVVVDIGCGIGRFTRPIAHRARFVHALDISGEMIERARREHGDLTNVEWVHGSGVDLRPLADASADVCFSLVVFQHIPDPRVTLGYVRDMGRVLRPGGWAGFQVSTAPQVHRSPRAPLRSRLRDLLGRGRGAPADRGHPAWLGSALDLDALRATAGEAGLVVERVVGAGTQFCLVLLRRRALG